MKVVIIGGGAAGMLAAIAASQNINNNVIIVEKNEKLGKKLYISGKGRCNLTNNCSSNDFFKNIIHNSRFLYSSFNTFSNADLKKIIESNGCPLKVERGGRVFPVSDKSSDVIKALQNNIKKKNIRIIFNVEINTIKKLNDGTFNIVGARKDFDCDKRLKNSVFNESNIDKIVVATGGLSYKSTGSTGDGYRFAKDFNIAVTKTYPALVPFNINEVDECRSLQGLTLKNIGIKIYDDKKLLYTDFGELLFTHFGVSGPTILSASSIVNDLLEHNTDTNGKSLKQVKHSSMKHLTLSIDLKPALTEEKLDDRLIREFEQNSNKSLKSILESLLPKSMVDVFADRLCKESVNLTNSNINDDKCTKINNIKSSDVTKALRRRIVNLLKDFRFIVIGTRGYDEAIVTRGGIDIKEINPKNMESKKVKGLHFAGEVLDIDAFTGGFNIQIAATTGYVAGLDIETERQL